MHTDNTLDVRFDRAGALQTLDERGWIQNAWEGNEGVCLHQAIRLCSPVPGDAYIIEHVWDHRGKGTTWNDHRGRAQHEIVHALKEEPEVTDAEIEGVFGPRWREVVALVRRAAVLTDDERCELGLDFDVHSKRAVQRAYAVLEEVGPGPYINGATAFLAASSSGNATAGQAALAIIAQDLIGDHYDQADHDALMGPWLAVVGPEAGR